MSAEGFRRIAEQLTENQRRFLLVMASEDDEADGAWMPLEGEEADQLVEWGITERTTEGNSMITAFGDDFLDFLTGQFDEDLD